MAKKKKKKVLPKELPAKFVDRLERLVGTSRMAEVRKTFVDKPTTFRVNTLKAKKADIDEVLKREGFKTERVSWYGDAYILRNKSKRELTSLPIYAEGKIYIQSLASMVPPLVLDPQAGERVLDLTAAPGSKTSQMAAMMNQQGELVANDLNKVRFFRLKHNMEMLGVADEADNWDFVLRMEDGSALSTEYRDYFDKVLVDAPCSGEARFIDGVPKTYGFWSEHKIKQVAYRQHKLIMAAWSTVKPGGEMVYSTCTMAPEENEARISKFLSRVDDAEVIPVKLKDLKTLAPVKTWKDKPYDERVDGTLRILPTKDVEGFYIARIKKKIVE